MRGQRHASFLPAFTDASHMGAVSEMNCAPVEADQLGEAQACLGREQQQGVIAASEPCCSIRSSKNRLDLGAPGNAPAACRAACSVSQGRAV